MNRQSTPFRLAWIFMWVSLLGMGWGCGKRAVSSSGDQGTVAGESRPVERIKPEPLATMPPEKSGTIETARPALAPTPAPLESAGRAESAESSVPPAPPVSPSPSVSPAPSESVIALAEPSQLEDIYFDYDRSSIRNDAQAVLESNASWIKQASAKSILIEGHCDERGTLSYNLVLGEKRAKAAKRYLEDLGIPSSRLKVISYGEVRPICREHEDRCWNKNRRAHFVAQ